MKKQESLGHLSVIPMAVLSCEWGNYSNHSLRRARDPMSLSPGKALGTSESRE